MEQDWALHIKNNVAQQKAHLHKRDVSFFQVDQLVRIAERLDPFGNQCAECRGYKKVLEDISESLANYINSTPAMKRQFEKQTDPVKKHLKMAHQIFPVYFFLSFYTFLGIATGSVFGLLAGLIFYSYFNQILIASIITATTMGYFLGTRKDWKVRIEKRLL